MADALGARADRAGARGEDALEVLCTVCAPQVVALWDLGERRRGGSGVGALSRTSQRRMGAVFGL